MRNLTKFALTGAVALLLAGCGSNNDGGATTNNDNNNADSGISTPSGRIHLFNWGYFIDPDLLVQFEEETGIEVMQSLYSSNEEMYSRFVAGTDLFDVMVPSDYMIDRLIQEELLRPLNWDNIPNVEHINTRLMDRPFDRGNVFSMPYKWGTLGILYNTTMVNHEVNSWDSLFNPDYAGEILMYNSERDAFVVPFARLGFSLNTTNQDEIDQARDMLIDQMPLVKAYVTDQVMDMMADGQAAMALVYSGDASHTILDNSDLNYVIPQEGSNLWINSLVIPHNSPNPEAAEVFLNFMMRPDVAAQNTDWVGYTTVNQTAIDEGLIDEELVALSSFNITDEDYNRLEVFVDLGPERELITNAFTQVLASGH